MQRRLATKALCVDVGSFRQQRSYFLLVSKLRRFMQGSAANPIPGIDLGAISQQQSHDSLGAKLRCYVQCGAADVVAGVDFGLIGQQKCRYVPIAIDRSPVQRRPAVVVPAGNQLRIFSKDGFNFCQVSGFGCVVNRPAENGNATNQHHE
jgi:hypothetical protein